MPLLPLLKPMFEAQLSSPPMPDDVPPAQMRAAMHAMIDKSFFALATPQAPVASERDITIAVRAGEITLRLYRGAPENALLPCHVYYHGGGFFLGTLDQSDNYCRALARAVGCAVVSVDYRLAPEHRFPTAAEDAYSALVWTASHAQELRIDPALISVGGGSAGGNLAAVVAQMARERLGPSIVAQVLEIPVTDFTSMLALEFPDEGIRFEPAKAYAPLYLRDETDAHDPLASPLLAKSLSGLPPALVVCAEYDQLQPEGEDYARRLSEAGVPTTYRLLHGQFHGSQGFDAVIPAEAAAYREEIASFLTEAYRKQASVRAQTAI
ncbi:alpha/beta hydrolase [Novosphingobium sp. G106]|uniref:alpha/beta hydrolase n=1 Tax=Novosphingobium sp. G106 TaxID=2849500 RepID=UPI001C2D2F7B|nr:alpha/beta hydrolase [Novosphingobium sp. G106]MBV1690388.1 alpha/beta hydrolase [Novosphingobium sp. G106]